MLVVVVVTDGVDDELARGARDADIRRFPADARFARGRRITAAYADRERMFS